MEMKTTLGKLKEFNFCSDRYEHLCACLKRAGRKIRNSTEVSILDILNFNGVRDAFWAFRTQDYKDYCLILVDIAESVLHTWEAIYSNDKRLREAIQDIKDYKAGKISIDELGEDTDAAAIAVFADDAVAYTAYSNDAYSTYAYAGTALASAAAYCATKNQWVKNEEILRKHLTAEAEKP